MSNESPDTIDVRAADGVLHLRMQRPERKNALTFAMYEALTEGLTRAAGDAAIRVVTIAGTGGVFSSGNDLQDFMKQPRADEDSPVFRFLRALVALDKPLVAAVEGPAVGIGTTMLLHCDLVYAADSARFQLPFTQLALVPEAASSFLLPRMLGHQRAAELLLLGEPFDAARALELGIVNAVLPADALHAHVEERVQRLVALPAAALRATKRLLRAPRADDVIAHMQAEGEIFRERLGSPEFREAATAFMEKRRPDFSRFS